jgi:hypothetical protein
MVGNRKSGNFVVEVSPGLEREERGKGKENGSNTLSNSKTHNKSMSFNLLLLPHQQIKVL